MTVSQAPYLKYLSVSEYGSDAAPIHTGLSEPQHSLSYTHCLRQRFV